MHSQEDVTEIATHESSAIDAASPEEAAFHFHAQWATADTSSLRPNRLPLAKPQRAWERRPRIPSSRTNSRIGTVWKRPASMAPSTFVPPHIRANFLRRESSSPRVAAKKIRLDNDLCVGASVSQWDVRGSPTRKIVTRSGASDGEALLALSEDEAEGMAAAHEEVEDQGDVTIEIVNEDGTVANADEHSLVEEARDWDDVEEGLPFDDGLMHLTDAVPHKQLLPAAPPSDATSAITQAADEEPGETTPEPAILESRRFPVDAPEARPAALHVHPPVVLPEGFVSPLKERRRLGAGSRRRPTGRRQTLPVQFAPALAVPKNSPGVPPPATDTISADVVPVKMLQNSAETAATLRTGPIISASEANVHEPLVEPDNDEWEDVSDNEEADVTDNSSDVAVDIDDPSPCMIEAAVIAQLEAEMTPPTLDPSQNEVPMADGPPAEPQVPALRDIFSDRALISSPIPTLAGPHPRLPLRRSPRREPRRKSTSPLKQSSTLPSSDRSHLIAFTPLRRQPSPPATNVISTPEQPTPADAVPTSILLQRSTPAPTARPGMSPVKTARPRISDDTALLQAFLNRAAESKTSRQSIISAELQSPMPASPVKKVQSSPASQAPEVLGELDPNSPSPRKSTDLVPESPLSRRGSGPVRFIMEQDEDNINFDPDEPVARTRSGRTRRKPQPLHSSAQPVPNKISIRGQASTVDIRKTQAQELALQTRNNTRRNKGQAILPVLRLKKIVAGDDPEETTGEGEVTNMRIPEPVRTKRRLSVTWAETLVAYSGDLVEPDTSVLTVDSTTCDEPQADDPPVAPRAVDTPSQPKMRKLRATRTAASATAQPAEQPSLPASSEKSLKPKRTQRRPRAATPAKGLTNASLLPEDLDVEPEPSASAPAPVPDKKALAATKRPTSRIPALASALGQGKENLVSSPPKKKLALAVPSSKTFAPKLDFPKPSAKLADEGVPGLTSPAKKGGRRPVTFSQGLETKRANNDETIPGLASPAKKRTRRMAA